MNRYLSPAQPDAGANRPDQGTSAPVRAGQGATQTIWLEWAVILLAVFVFCLPFLDLGSDTNLPGPESQYFQTFDQILENSIEQQGQFPLWNPYYFTGIPNVAHPMFHAFNPLVSLPVLVFGTQTGFKIAVFLAFVVAALGMWWLAKEFGLTPILRIWVALMFVFSGVAAAKFIQGQYLMVLALGWMPFSLAAMLAATRSKRPGYVCVASIGLALLFLCGNVYYAYYMLYVIACFALITSARLERNPRGPHPDRANLKRLALAGFLLFGGLAAAGLVLLAASGQIYYAKYALAAAALLTPLALSRHTSSPVRLTFKLEELKILLAIGVLAAGLIAIQLLPALQARSQYGKAVDPALTDSRSLGDTFLDFVSPDPFRPGGYSAQLRPEEFYAFIGWWPFIGMFMLPLAWKKQNKRHISLVLSLAIFTFAWIDVKDMPWRSLFQTIPLLYQFRFPSRMVAVGAMALISAGGLGLEQAWGLARKYAAVHSGTGRRWAGSLALVALAIVLAGSVANVALITRPRLRTRDVQQVPFQVAAWLRRFDPGIYYVSAPNRWDAALIGNQLRYLNGGYAFYYAPLITDPFSQREIDAGPKYDILPSDQPAQADEVLVKAFSTVSVYRTSDHVPFAFTVATDTLRMGAETSLNTQEVKPQTFFAPNVNVLEGTVESGSEKELVLLSTYTSDWQLSVDGKPAEVSSAYGYLAAKVPLGSHHYVFTYRPIWFFVGLGISLATLMAIIVILISDLVRNAARP